MFWCDCEKGYIYLSSSERCRKALKKIWQMQSKSFSTSPANAFDAKNADILPFSIRWIHNCIQILNDDASDASKSILPFTCLELFSWLKHLNNQLRKFGNQLAVDESFSKVMILFFSLTHRCHCVGHSLQHLSSWANGCLNEQTSTVFCPHLATHNECVWDVINSRWNLFKNCHILNFFAVWFFLDEEDNNILNTFVFVFHKFRNFFLFLSWPNKHHRHKQTRSEFAKVDVT